MIKNKAIPVDALLSGDEKEIANYGPQKMDAEELNALRSDEIIAVEEKKKVAHRFPRRNAYRPIEEYIDAIFRAAVTKILFDLTVTKVKSQQPGNPSSYPVLNLIPNVSEDNDNDS